MTSQPWGGVKSDEDIRKQNDDKGFSAIAESVDDFIKKWFKNRDLSFVK